MEISTSYTGEHRLELAIDGSSLEVIVTEYGPDSWEVTLFDSPSGNGWCVEMTEATFAEVADWFRGIVLARALSRAA